MVDKPAGQKPSSRPPYDPAERSALAHTLFAQLRAAAESEGAGPGADATPARAVVGPAGVQPATVGGIRVVGPASQARAAAAAAQGRTQAQGQGHGRSQGPGAARPAGARGGARGVKSGSRWRLKFRLLPITIFLLVLMLGVRVGDSWRVLTRGGSLPEVTQLQAQTPPPAPKEGAAKEGPAKEGAGKEGEAAKGGAPAADAGLGKPATVDLELVKHLTDRREELDARARVLDQREALMVAAEKRLDEKLTELQGVRGEIQALLKQVDEKQKAQIESLVRIYETMKPKDAARIFEALDMPVLLEVVERMKEAKTAPILGAMDPIKAKDLTTALAERRRLPAVPQ